MHNKNNNDKDPERTVFVNSNEIQTTYLEWFQQPSCREQVYCWPASHKLSVGQERNHQRKPWWTAWLQRISLSETSRRQNGRYVDSKLTLFLLFLFGHRAPDNRRWVIVKRNFCGAMRVHAWNRATMSGDWTVKHVWKRNYLHVPFCSIDGFEHCTACQWAGKALQVRERRFGLEK